MKNYLSSLGLGAVTIVSVMGLLSLTAGLTASTDATRSIVFTTQQVRSVVGSMTASQRLLQHQQQKQQNFVSQTITQVVSVIGIPGGGVVGNQQNNTTNNTSNGIGIIPHSCTPNCNDTIDNDSDTYIDQKDYTCYDQPNGGGTFHDDRDESMGNCTNKPNNPIAPTPNGGGGTFIGSFCSMNCNDTIDNDSDTYIDANDPECTIPGMGYIPWLDEQQGSQCLTIMCQSTCNNQVDDNGDGLVDDQDPKCIDPLTKTYNPSFSELFGGVCYNWKMKKQTPPSCVSNCDDTKDNDNDGSIDTNDFNCYEIVNNTKVYHPEYDEKLGTCGGTGKQTPPPPPPPPSCGSQTSPICDSYTDPVRKGECNNLMRLYTCTDGPNWKTSTKRNTSADYCTWYGITCNSQNMVITLYLNNNSLTGSIPDFDKLPNLQTLSLYNNKLVGSIPEFDKLPNLITLDLGGNQLVGSIPEFDKLPNLRTLYLNNNSLTGSIPNFDKLPNLITLYLSNNQLVGSIPDFDKLPNLQTLNLGGNQLVGSIPEFDKLPNLRTLYLSNNQLVGSIPDFDKLPNLQTLNLYNNKLVGSIPEFDKLPNLRTLDLSNNQLVGSIPDFDKLPNLKNLDLRYNQLTGSIPDFDKLPNLQTLNLGGNQLVGNPQTIIEKMNLKYLCIGGNKLTGLGDINSGWLKDYQTNKSITYCTLVNNLKQ